MPIHVANIRGKVNQSAMTFDLYFYTTNNLIYVSLVRLLFIGSYIVYYQAIAPIVIFGSMIFAQNINSTCLSLNSLTATRHGVIIVWQKLKIVAYTSVHGCE